MANGKTLMQVFIDAANQPPKITVTKVQQMSDYDFLRDRLRTGLRTRAASVALMDVALEAHALVLHFRQNRRPAKAAAMNHAVDTLMTEARIALGEHFNKKG